VPDDFDPERRKLLEALGTAGATALAGCSFEKDNNEWREDTPTPTPEPEAPQGTFQYFFNDQTGTLGQVGDQNIPEDAPDWQVVDNELEENDWQEMESNDLEGAKKIIERKEWDTQVGMDGQKNRTQQYFKNPEEAFQATDFNQEYEGDIWNAHDAVIYTASLMKASFESLTVGTSGGRDTIINSIAEPVLNDLDIEIPGYSLSTHVGTEPTDAAPNDEEDIGHWDIERNVAPADKDAQFMKESTGLSHLLGLLQYRDEEGGQQVRYVETAGTTGPYRSWLREPE